MSNKHITIIRTICVEDVTHHNADDFDGMADDEIREYVAAYPEDFTEFAPRVDDEGTVEIERWEE